LVVGAATTSTVRPSLLNAQQKPMPMIGWLYTGAPGSNAQYMDAFRQGLGDVGYVERQNVAIEHRWADDRYERLPALAADLVERKVDVIVTIGSAATVQTARRASSRIPIVFGTGGDPVALGLVASLARPAGNLTGVSYLVVDLVAKRLELLLQAVPQVRLIGLLVNPGNSSIERIVPDMQEAARAHDVQLLVVKVGTEGEIDEGFGTLVRSRAGAVVIQADPFIHSRRRQLLDLAARHAVPAIYTWRQFAEEGGLISYGPNLSVVYRQMGNYVGRILKGASAADLPVVQPTAFELVINLKTAKALGITVPPTLLAGADELIE
jgi:putative ABC transport system substrate-binding protein